MSDATDNRFYREVDRGDGRVGETLRGVERLHRPEDVFWLAEDCPTPSQHYHHHMEGRYSNDDICTACPPLHQTCSTSVEYGEHGPEPLRYPCPTVALLAATAPTPDEWRCPHCGHPLSRESCETPGCPGDLTAPTPDEVGQVGEIVPPSEPRCYYCGRHVPNVGPAHECTEATR